MKEKKLCSYEQILNVYKEYYIPCKAQLDLALRIIYKLEPNNPNFDVQIAGGVANETYLSYCMLIEDYLEILQESVNEQDLKFFLNCLHQLPRLLEDKLINFLEITVRQFGKETEETEKARKSIEQILSTCKKLTSEACEILLNLGGGEQNGLCKKK